MSQLSRLEADLVTNEELEVELDDELVDDHGDNLEVDEEKISACTPYLARQMSCLGRRTLGEKDTLNSARGAKEVEDLLTRREIVELLR